MPSLAKPTPRILIAVDLSEPARRALHAGCGLARDLGAEVVLLHATGALDLPSLASTPPIGAPGLDLSHPEAENGQRMAIMTNEAQAWADWVKAQGLKLTTVERAGPAVDVILEEAERNGCLLIVVGHTAGSAFKSILLGSVAKNLVRRSRLPVLVVPFDADAPLPEDLPKAMGRGRRARPSRAGSASRAAKRTTQSKASIPSPRK